MSRCKCCDAPLVGQVRYKSNEEFKDLFVEEDMCNACIFVVDNIEFLDTSSYQFEDYTENMLSFLSNH